MKFVVKPHRPEAVRRRRLGLYGLALLLFLSGWGLGWFYHSAQLQALRQQVRTLSLQVDRLEQDNQRYREENIDLQQQEKVRAAAIQDLRQQMAEVNRQLDQAHNELLFFNNLMAESVQNPGLAVHELRILPTAAAQVFQYRLVLRQSLKKAREQTGQYWFTLSGVQGERSREVRWPKTGPAGAYRFKYFQPLQGMLDLPQGFVPESVTVHLAPGNKTRKTGQKRKSVIETTLPWQPESNEEQEHVQERPAQPATGR